MKVKYENGYCVSDLLCKISVLCCCIVCGLKS